MRFISTRWRPNPTSLSRVMAKQLFEVNKYKINEYLVVSVSVSVYVSASVFAYVFVSVSVFVYRYFTTPTKTSTHITMATNCLVCDI